MPDFEQLPDGRRGVALDFIRTKIRMDEVGVAHATLWIEGERVADLGALWVTPLDGPEDPVFLNWTQLVGEYANRVVERVCGEKPTSILRPAGPEAGRDVE